MIRRMVLSLIFSTGLIAALASSAMSQETTVVRIGITPFQDTVIPVIPDRLGWYAQDAIRVEFVDIDWTDVPLALAADEIDLALYSMDSLLASLPSLKKAGRNVIFYGPLYVFKGAAIMVAGNKGYETLGSIAGLDEQTLNDRIKAVVGQLKGRTIAITEGTTSERIVKDALKAGDVDLSEVTLVHGRYEDNLAAFLAGSVDAFAAGLTERIQARKSGAVGLLLNEAVSSPVIDGWATTGEFVQQNPETLWSLTSLFFRAVTYMEEDLKGRAHLATDYLKGKASVEYSDDEYAIAWTFQYFPKNKQAARDAFLAEDSPYFWKHNWDATTKFLRENGKIKEDIPYDSFLAIGQSIAKEANAEPSETAAKRFFVHEYQTLISGLLALGVGLVTGTLLWIQIHKDDRRRLDTADSLARMFLEELIIFGRYLVESVEDIIAMMGGSTESIGSWEFPGQLTFQSQKSRLVELNPETATNIMYLYQSLAAAERLLTQVRQRNANAIGKETATQLGSLCRLVTQHTLESLALLKDDIQCEPARARAIEGLLGSLRDAVRQLGDAQRIPENQQDSTD